MKTSKKEKPRNYGHLKDLALLFIALKLLNKIDWQWYLVLWPYWYVFISEFIIAIAKKKKEGTVA